MSDYGSPENNRIALNTDKMQGWWKLPEYISARKLFVKAKPVCGRCGRKATTPLHRHEDYISFEKYIGVVRDLSAQSGCSICNKMERSNRRPCPECVQRYHAGEQETIHYITLDRDICPYCEDPDFLKKARERKETRNDQRNDYQKKRYRACHPKKVIRGGLWVTISRRQNTSTSSRS